MNSITWRLRLFTVAGYADILWEIVNENLSIFTGKYHLKVGIWLIQILNGVQSKEF